MVGNRSDDKLCGSGQVPLQGAIVVCYGGNFGGVDVVPLQGAIIVCYGCGGGGGGDDHSGSGVAGCHCRVPISVSYLPSIFRATNFTQKPMKTAMNFVLSFLQTLHCSLH